MPAASTPRTRFVTDQSVVAIPHQDLLFGQCAELSDFVTNVPATRFDRHLGRPVLTVTAAESARCGSREALDAALRQAPPQPDLDVWAYDRRDGK